jgi:hypothetical protein
MTNVLKPSRKKVDEINLLLGLFELKNYIREEEVLAVVHQTLTYMVSALAYIRWGVLQDCEPLVALVVASNCVYRLTLSRTKKNAMGFLLAIDKAKDVAAMEWMLSDYIQRYISEHRKISALAFDSTSRSVNPFEWAPLNFGNSDWTPLSVDYNFGFLFRTTSDEVVRLVENDQQLTWDVGTLSPGMDVIVKYVNLVLDIDLQMGTGSIKQLLTSSALSLIQQSLRTASLDSEATGPSEYPTSDDGSRVPVPAARKSQSDTSPTTTPSKLQNPLGIKHPYLAIIKGLSGPLIVMEDVGPPLSQVMQSPRFRQDWARSASLRRAFFSDVGLSALNLVVKVGLCHNDIRPPNIAYRSDSFCLIDFDFSRQGALSNELSAFAPSLSTISALNQCEQMMVFSVAQIALTVFMLSACKVFDLGDVTEAVSTWNQMRGASEVDAEFERWVQGKGGLALEFVSACRGATEWPSALTSGEDDAKRYLSDVLQDMLL